MSDAFKGLLMVSEQPEQQMEFHLLCLIKLSQKRVMWPKEKTTTSAFPGFEGEKKDFKI